MAEWIALRELALASADADFRRRARQWRAAFARSDARDVALYDEDAGAFAAALFGAWHAGKRVFLLPDALPATLHAVAAHVQAFAGAQIPPALDPLRADEEASDNIGLQPLDPESTQLAVFTSGSTGAPEAIAKSLRQLQAEVEAQERQFGALLGDAGVLGTVSHQHIYGLLHRVLWPLAAGRAILRRSFFHEEILAAARASDGPVYLVSSPAHLKRIPADLDWAALRGKLRAVFSSGGALPDEAALAARAVFGVAPTEIFGSSETGGIAIRHWADDAPAWRALPGVAWRIADETLEVRSPHLPDADAWWKTSDRAAADGHGGFRVLGRADRIVKIEERRVSLDALERALLEHAFVREAKVLVLERPTRKQLAAVVALNEAGEREREANGRAALARSFGEFLAGGFDAVARPRRWRFVAALPLNAQGKTTLADLSALFADGALYPQATWLQRGETSAELEFALDADLRVFDGHFPQAAILPGVAQTDWAIHFGREAFAMPPRFLRIDTLKFVQIARPGMRVNLALEWDAARSALSFRYRSALGVHASGKAVFSDEGGADA